MRKKILFIASIYRVGERIYPLIPELHKFADIDLLQVNEMSKDMHNYGNINYRKIFHDKYDAFFDNIYDGTISSIESQGARNSNPSSAVLDIDVKKYDMIFYDDNRNRHGLWSLYDNKRSDCIMIANTHGNTTLNPQPYKVQPEGHSSSNYIVDNYKKVFDYCFVHGDEERDAYDDISYIISGGIPSNDQLKYYERTNDFILIVVNFLGNAPVCPYKLRFDEALFNQMRLVELQNKYNKQIVIKTKSRANHTSVTADHTYINSILPNELQYQIIADFEDNNQLVCGASLVIGSTSGLSFKPIQRGIPTVLINKTGCIGSFHKHRSLIDIESDFLEKVALEMDMGKDDDYINSILEGGSDFNSTGVYINTIKELL